MLQLGSNTIVTERSLWIGIILSTALNPTIITERTNQHLHLRCFRRLPYRSYSNGKYPNVLELGNVVVMGCDVQKFRETKWASKYRINYVCKGIPPMDELSVLGASSRKFTFSCRLNISVHHDEGENNAWGLILLEINSLLINWRVATRCMSSVA